MNVDIPTYLSFFSGIGGLDLAVRLVAPEARCCGYVEIEVPAVGILAARMEDGSLETWLSHSRRLLGLLCSLEGQG